MARYRKIEVRIWNDRKFRALDDKAKLAFLLILTHPDTNQLGFIRTRSMALALDLGWQSDAMSNAIQTLCRMRMLMVDEAAGLMFIPNFLKHNPPNGLNGVKSWDGLLDLLPECDLLDEALLIIKPFVDGLSEGMKKGVPDSIVKAIRMASECHPNAILQPSLIQEQEQEQEQEIKTCPARASADACAKEAKSAVAEPVDKTLLPFPSVMPEGWKAEAKKLRSDVIPEKVFFRLAGRYAATTERRTMTIWKRIYLAKVSGERFATVNAKPVPRNETPAQRANREFEENGGRTVPDKYLPNGEIDWGILTADSVQAQCRTDNA